MKLEIIGDDPLKILTTTKSVVTKAQFVNLSDDGLEKLADSVDAKLKAGLETVEEGFGAKGNFQQDAQLIFLQSAVNFCFWAGKDEPRWQMDWQGKSYTSTYGMINSFQRALDEGVPILDANFLACLSRKDVVNFFRSNNETEIPLLDERLRNLQEAGEVLQRNYGGQFANALKIAGLDAVNLVHLLVADFSSFRDISRLEAQDVLFLKRAQICANDLSYLAKSGIGKPISNLDKLTAFADYKIPQILREAGVISYTDDLADRIENYVEIPRSSREEAEIRAATVWGVELVRQRLDGRYTAAQIDNAIWLLSQDQTGFRPYHRTRTIYY